ncbi:hypothetical protein BH23GEM9_BH23GEM9_32230 [soil metagenome]
MTLRVVTADPLNAEASLPAIGAPVTPVAEFYIRSNFTAPRIDAANWRLRLHGRVGAVLELTLAELQELAVETRRVTLECAGNGRALLEPATEGTPWGLGAAGTADFTGVRLRDVLELAATGDDAVECVFTGADAGDIDGWGRISFQRSLPLDTATATGPLLAWAMNGAELTVEHGYPLRLVVPNYYAVASVKWLVDIEAVATPFKGHFQTDRYMYRLAGYPPRPVTLMRVRSLITSHADGDRIAAGDVVIAGVAWSGHGSIQRVEVAAGADAPWHEAELEQSASPEIVSGGIAQRWHCRITLAAGMHHVRVRATDDAGETQPDEPAWNELGYGNNVIHGIRLEALSV